MAQAERSVGAHNLAQSRERPRYANLMQELLFALVGVTGDVFADDWEHVKSKHGFHPPVRSTFRVTDDIRWVDAADRALMNEILTMGFHFRQIQRFVAAQQDLGSALDGSICWRALAIGLEGAHRSTPRPLSAARSHIRAPAQSCARCTRRRCCGCSSM